MKIAIVRSRYTPFGGAERFVERALGALIAEGAEVTLIARSWAGAPDQNFRQIVCNPPYNKLFGRTARDKSFATAVQAEMARGAYDIVQSHERIPGCMIFRAGDGVHAAWLERRAQLAPWPTGARLMARLSPYHRYICAAEAAMFAHPDLRAVICNSGMVRDEIVRYYGVPAEKLHVIHNGVDLERFHPRLAAQHRAAVRAVLGINDATPLMLYVGNGFARKGVPQLIAALAQANRHEAHLAIVGGDRKLDEAKKQAERLGLAARVHFLGPQKDVTPYYGAADAFALPTLYDPFPNAALEALACGLPVVTTSACGVAEILTPGENGFVVAPGSVEELAVALDAVLALPAAARQAARVAAEPLSLGAMTEKLLDLYRKEKINRG